GLSKGGVHFLHNTVAGSTPVNAAAIDTDTIQAATLRNNIIANHAAAIKADAPGQGIRAEHNLYFANAANEVGTISSSNNLEADPRFVDPTSGDFHLGEGSRAIDNGLDGGITVDLDGLLRPQGKGFDIGAFEFEAAPAPNPSRDFTVYLPLVVK
ncbi:MAG TPA: choice-of-anchor Q domain-containing protein, partial [Anaerolineae bacterium]